MKTIIIFLLMLISCDKTAGQLSQMVITDGDVYMYEYAMKKPNQLHVGFIIINNDLIVQNISFTVNFSKDKIKNVFRNDNEITNPVQYSKKRG